MSVHRGSLFPLPTAPLVEPHTTLRMTGFANPTDFLNIVTAYTWSRSKRKGYKMESLVELTTKEDDDDDCMSIPLFPLAFPLAPDLTQVLLHGGGGASSSVVQAASL